MTELLFLEQTPSTNSFLKHKLETEGIESGSAVVTFRQTEGRGQKGNEWITEPDAGICYSLLMKPDSIPARNQFVLTEIVSLAVKGLMDELVRDVTIKWPNDIYHKDRKLAGILIENKLEASHIAHTIIGIGINVNQTEFPSDLPNPVSLRQITGTEHDLTQLSGKLHRRLLAAFVRLTDEDAEIRKFYLNSLYRRDGYHRYKDEKGEFMARILTIDTHGRLVLEPEEGLAREYGFQEIRFL